MMQQAMQWDKERRRLILFALVGLSGTLVDTLALLFLKQQLGWNTGLANSVSYSFGIVNNFWWNRSWVYPEARRQPVWRSLGQFAVVSVGALVLNTLLVVVLEGPMDQALGRMGAGYVLAKIVATLVGFGWNFGLNRWWTFRDAT